MDILQSFFLAIVQGFTEFLPISSSGHLVLIPLLTGEDVQNVAFDAAVHFGSLIAVILYFRNDILQLTTDWAGSIRQGKSVGQSRVAWAVIWGTVPVGIAGLSFHFIYSGDFEAAHSFNILVLSLLSVALIYFLLTKRLTQVLYTLFAAAIIAALIGLAFVMGEDLRKSAVVLATTTIVFGLVLLAIDLMRQRSRSLNDIAWKDIVIIGLAQMIALIPGTSRSGITITAALYMGFKRQDAARFSFLLSIPAIILASGAELYSLIKSGEKLNLSWAAVGVGVLTSAITAYLCIHLFLKFIEKIGMLPFVVYRLLLGGVLFYMIYIGSL